MSTGHGKNFLAGSLVDQHYYFDEMEERVQFPAMFPVALLSCALLEKARQDNYAFETNPVVYTSHLISVDRRLLKTLKSNDRLHLLVTNTRDSARRQGTRQESISPAIASLLWPAERKSNSVSCRSGHGTVGGNAAGCRNIASLYCNRFGMVPIHHN